MLLNSCTLISDSNEVIRYQLTEGELDTSTVLEIWVRPFPTNVL